MRVGRMSRADADANLTWQIATLPAGYARPHWIRAGPARCAISQARWQFMAWQRTERIPGNAGYCMAASVNRRRRAVVAATQSMPGPLRSSPRRRINQSLTFSTASHHLSDLFPVRRSPFRRAICGASSGLEPQSEGAGATTSGLIRAGRYFVENTDDQLFARRVLQVGYELRHIDQWRAGMVGPARKAEREFLAHFWVATTPEPSGTGCMPHATRVNVIDAALGNFYCMSQG